MAAFKNIFTSIPLLKPKRNVFDLSFDNLVSLNFGDLVPIMCKEVLPGDTWQVQSSCMVRFAPMLAPIMHRVNVYVHYFFVPNRLLWSDFEDFITGGRDGMANPVFPRLLFDTAWDEHTEEEVALRRHLTAPGCLSDYLGLPVVDIGNEDQWNGTYCGREINVLPFAAYQKIYNDYYRDQNLQEEIDVKEIVDDNPNILYGTVAQDWSADYIDSPSQLFKLRKRAWEKDYFTSALPWPQRGGDVHLPLNGDAPIKYGDADGKPLSWPDDVVRGDGHREGLLMVTNDNTPGPFAGMRTLAVENNDSTTGQSYGSIDNSANLHADLSDVTAATVNELRRAVRLQEWLEKNARSGARYIEQILSHFGVRSSDARLDRAEYLGGGKAPVQISEVLQTSETTSESPLGEFAGHGLSVGNSNKFRKFFEEHGFVMGIMSIIPRSSYAGGLPKIFTKFDKFDYAWPEFANLGEQEIKLSELDAAATAGRNAEGTSISGNNVIDPVFGYTPRYAEYKFSLNEIHGDFLDTMRYWHLGRIFDLPSGDSVPKLNQDFIQVRSDDDNLKRIFAVEDATKHHLWCEVYNRVTVKRTLPKFGAPTL